MNDDDAYETLRTAYMRLHHAARAVVLAAQYDAGDQQAKIYSGQLRSLKRELSGTPQPSGIRFDSMSTS